MRLLDRYDGGGDPFEGERTIVWRSLPAGAVVTKAVIELAPVLPPGAGGFIETLRFGVAGPAFGATVRQAASGIVEVDFHARRTAVFIAGLQAPNPTLLSVDIGGGVFLAVAADGTMPAPAGGPPFDFSNGDLPGLSALRMRLADATLPSDLGTVSIDIATLPSNLTLRFGKQLPFFSRLGDLALPATTPDITDAVQRALADAPVVNGYYSIPLVVHSDTLGRLAVILDVTWLGTAPLIPDGLREVVLPYDASSLTTTTASAMQAAVPAGAEILSPQTAIQLRGAFQNARVAYGPTGETATSATLRCSGAETLAQPVLPPADVTVSAVDLYLAAEGSAARLALDLRADFDGKPNPVSLLTRPVPFDLAGDPQGTLRWTTVALAAPALLQGGSRYWLVVQALDGSAMLGADAAPDPQRLAQRSTDAGFSWRLTGVPAPLLARLRFVPDRFQMPVDFVAGSGAQASRRKLNAYDPLGKIDMVINRPEIAAAVQSYLDAAAPPRCAARAVLLNPDFAQWQARGDMLAAVPPIEGLKGGVDLFETFFDRLLLSLDPGHAQALAWSADGATLYAAEPQTLLSIDPRTGGSTRRSIPLSPIAVAADPTGTGLYALDDTGLFAIDPADPATAPNLLSLKGGQALAVAPDGSRVYAASDKTIVAFDVASQTPVYQVTLTSQRQSLALTPDGALLVALDQNNGRVAVFDAAGGAAQWSAAMPGGSVPQAVAVSADGSLIYAAGLSPAGTNLTGIGLAAFDLRGRVQQMLTLDISAETGLRIAVKPQGDRVYVGEAELALDPSGATLAVSAPTKNVGVVSVGTRLPLHWTLTAGSVMPMASRADPGRVVAVLSEGSLSQVQPVSPGCPHDFSVTGRVRPGRSQHAQADGVVELFWLDASGALLRTDSLALATAPVSTTQKRALMPPPASAQVEARVRVAGGECVIEAISLRSTDAALRPDGWLTDPAAPAGIVVTRSADGTIYRNLGAADGAIVQTASLLTDAPHELVFAGAVLAAGAAGLPSIEAVWQDAAGAALGAPPIVALDGPAFGLQPAVIGTPPAGASAVRVRVRLPAGSALRLEGLEALPRPAVSVPVGFVAQSPGELHVSNARIAYDLRPPPAPAPPAGGLAPPTPPDRKPGEPGAPCCLAPALSPTAATGTLVGALLPRPSLRPAPVAPPPVPQPQPSGPAPPLAAVAELGPARVRRLNEIGITTVQDLATALPERVLAALAGPAMAELAARVVERAKALVSPSSTAGQG